MAQLSEKITIHLTEEELSEIREYCNENGISLNEFVRETLMKDVRDNKKSESLSSADKNYQNMSKAEEKQIIKAITDYEEKERIESELLENVNEGG